MSAQALLDESKIAEERQKAFMESKFQPTNQKYGLFSYTGTLAISDRPYFSRKFPPRDSDGKVITSPRNFYTSPVKKGKTSDVYFSSSNYYSDNYAEPSKIYSKDHLRAEQMKKAHSSAWKPGGPKFEPLSLFPHEPTEQLKKFSFKGADGKVITGPRNFITSPPKRGAASTTPGVLLGPISEYLPDPYNRKRDLLKTEMIKHKSKLQSSPFKGMDHGNRIFSEIKSLEVNENKEKSQIQVIKSKESTVPFYSLTARVSDCFNKYPEHMPDVRVLPTKTSLGDKPSWKSTTTIRTIPSPSISSSFKNLRSEFPMLRH